MDTPSLVPLTEPENEGGLHVRRPSFTPGYIAVAWDQTTTWCHLPTGYNKSKWSSGQRHAIADQIAPVTTVTMETTTYHPKYLNCRYMHIWAHWLEWAHDQTQPVSQSVQPGEDKEMGAVDTMKHDIHCTCRQFSVSLYTTWWIKLCEQSITSWCLKGQAYI